MVHHSSLVPVDKIHKWMSSFGKRLNLPSLDMASCMWDAMPKVLYAIIQRGMRQDKYLAREFCDLLTCALMRHKGPWHNGYLYHSVVLSASSTPWLSR